ncbi:hypothetical protein GF312_02075 [Candidatus Poribacteria bacterium]|nr:hypothetical protein [Candidatus Poribacteria bacterium]
MVSHGGALGDNGFTIPTLTNLRKKYEEIYLFCKSSGFKALKDTGLIERFIIQKPDMENLTNDERRKWLFSATRGLDFHAKLNFNGVIPSRYMFHKGDPKFEFSSEWKRQNAEDVSFFDAFAKKAEAEEAIGKRPFLFLSSQEKEWLKNFRYEYGIPDKAFLLGWQFTGSSRIKWYPFFDIVIQRNIMRKHPQVYVLGLGDLMNKIKWNRRFHGGRFINLGNSISFRQAYILTSILDCLVAPETGIMVFAQAWEHVPKILLATHTYGYHITFGYRKSNSDTKIIQSEAKCSPCYNILADCYRDGDKPWCLCMGKISPEKVIDAIEKVIKR